jgi:hypothetical protein
MRATSIGYGHRFKDMISKSEAPPPITYTINSLDFNNKTKGFHFGISREKFAKVFIKENMQSDPCIPGPGSYRPKTNAIEKNNGAFSIRPRTNFQSIFTDFTKGFPGPGSYEASKASDNQNGFTLNSRFKSPLGAKISSSGKRFDDTFFKRVSKLPGPGEYSPRSESNVGNYFIAKYRNSGAPVFSKGKRLAELDLSQTRKITPGPGSYRIQSEFGFYYL